MTTRSAVATDRIRALVGVLVLAAVAVGCATPKNPSGSRADVVRVPGQVRIVIESTIDSEDLRRRLSRALRWLTGSPDDADVLGRPYGAAWRGDALLVTDPGHSRVLRIERGKKVLLSSVGEFSQPIGIASCDAGVVVTDSRRGTVTLLDDRLEHVYGIATGLERPTGVACSGGRLFVTETGRHRLVVYELGGVETARDPRASTPARFRGQRGESRGEFNYPAAVAVDHGRIWVGDVLNFRVQELNIETEAVHRVFGRLGDSPGDMPRIKAVAVDVVGNVWIADAHLRQVSVFSPDGDYLLGLTGAEAGGEVFSFPSGIAASADGRVAVVDSLGRRIVNYRVIEDRSGGR